MCDSHVQGNEYYSEARSVQSSAMHSLCSSMLVTTLCKSHSCLQQLLIHLHYSLLLHLYTTISRWREALELLREMEKIRENYDQINTNSGQMAYMKMKDSSANGNASNVRNNGSNRKGSNGFANNEPPPAPNVICYSAAITACERGGTQRLHACRHCIHVDTACM
jgi:hypothetical protein